MIKRMFVIIGSMVIVYSITFAIYYNSDIIIRVNKPASNGRHKAYAMVADRPRNNLIYFIVYKPGLEIASLMDNTLYIQGDQLKVRKLYWDNFELLFSGQEFY